MSEMSRNLAGAGLGWLSEKWLDSAFASAGAEICCNPKYHLYISLV